MPLRKAIEEAHNHNYCKAVRYFEQAYTTNPHNFTNENKYLYAKSLNKCYNENQNLQHVHLAAQLSKEVYIVEPQYKLNTSLYMWLTYKCYVSAKAQNIPRDLRLRAANFIIQNTRQENFSPYELTITEIVKFLEEDTPRNPAIILEWHQRLSPKLLNPSSKSFQRDNGEIFEDASPLEKWLVKNIKLLLETKQYETCIVATDSMIRDIQSPFRKFHHNNDIWSQRRKAQALTALQKTDEAYLLLQKLVQKLPHSALYYDLMKISRLQGNAQQALIFGAEGLLDKAGKYEHKLKILKDCAEILASQALILESYAHYALIQKVRERNEWRPDSNILTEMVHLQEMAPSCKPFSNKKLQELWHDWTLQQYEIDQGIVKNILPNQKSGFIKAEDNQRDFYFNIKNSDCTISQLVPGTRVSFRKKPSFDRSRNIDSTEAFQIILLGNGEY